MEPFSNFLASILLSRDEHPSEYQPGQEVEEEGRRRSSLQALRTPEDYFAVEGEGISITVRLKRSIVAQNLYIESRRYGITARVPEFGDAIPSSLIVTLVENSLRVLLDEVMVHERGAGTEFQLSISHRLFEEGPISSGIWPLSEESMEPGLSELLSRLIRVTQSKTREILFQDLEVELTLIRRPSLEGTGLLLPLPSTYAKKRYRATQGTGSVFYNTSQEYCFFTSIFHARAYNAFQDKMRGEGIAARKRGRRRLQQILDADDSSTVCYFEKFQINIRLANQDVASYPLLRSISEKMGVQISIHDEVQDFRRILMYPPQFCPNLEQIVLLRCTLLLEQEEKKSAQELSHYVSLRSPQALLSALRQSYCVLCGASVGRYTSHRCKRSDTPAQETQCRVCLRPSVTSQNMALLMPANRKSFCEKTLQSRPRSKKVQPCKNCGDIGSTLLCGKIHQMRCKGKQRRCTECKKWFYVDRGRYAGRPNVLRHDSCLYERYCGICQGSVIDTSICPSDSNHTCFIKPLYSPPPFPSRIISFDLEAVDEPEGFRANTACLVFNSGRGDYSEFEAVVFGECSPPGYRFNGKPLGVSFPVKLPNQDQACLTRELVRPKNGEKRIKLLKSEKKYWSNPDRAPSFGDRQGTDEMDRPVLNFRPDVEELLHGSSEDDPGSEEQGDHSLLTVQGILRSMDQPLQAGDADGNIEPNAPSHEPSIDLLEEQSAGELSSTHSCSSEQSGGKGTFHDSTKERNPLALGPTADFNLQAYQARSEFWQGDSESSAGEQDNSYQGKDKKKKKKNRSSREMEKLVKSFICSEAVVSEEEAVEEDSEDSGEETEDQAADIGQTRNTTTSQEHSRSRAVEQEELGVVGGGLAEVVEDTNQVSNEETSGDNTSEASSTVSSLMADRIVEAQEFPDSPEFLNSPEAHGPDDPPEGELNEEDVDILISKLEVVGSETIEEARQRARVGLSWMKRHQDRVSLKHFSFFLRTANLLSILLGVSYPKTLCCP